MQNHLTDRQIHRQTDTQTHTQLSILYSENKVVTSINLTTHPATVNCLNTATAVLFVWRLFLNCWCYLVWLGCHLVWLGCHLLWILCKLPNYLIIHQSPTLSHQPLVTSLNCNKLCNIKDVQIRQRFGTLANYL